MPAPTGTTTTIRSGLKVQTHSKAGGSPMSANHHQTLTQPTGLKPHRITAEREGVPHHQTLARSLKMKSGLKAGRQTGRPKFEDEVKSGVPEQNPRRVVYAPI